MSDKILHQDSGEFWTAIHADCVEAVKALPDESIGYSIYSVPFASLYTYSNSDRDFGNCKDDAEFFAQMAFLIRELLRVTKPGRLTSIHCMNLPTSKTHHGYIGIRDFRGEIIRAFEAEGWVFHSEVCIWKDPVTAMQRTKAIGLLHKQMVKDSCMSRQGIPDYLVTLRKPGENKNPVAGELVDWIGCQDDAEYRGWYRGMTEAAAIVDSEGGGTHESAYAEQAVLKARDALARQDPEEFEKGIRAQWAADKSRDESAKATYPTFKSIMLWQRYASPVWMDINPSDTLQFRSAREQADERHICLASGSLVLTRENGYRKIEDIELGNHVLTHLGRWRPVIAKRCNGVANTVRVLGQGVADLRLTPDHKIWTKHAGSWDQRKNAQKRAPEWISAKATLGSYLNLRLPPVEPSRLTPHEWWIVGRWLGDGHRGTRRTSGKRGGGLGEFIISCSFKETPHLIERLGIHAGHSVERTATQITLIRLSREIRDVLNRCGHGAQNKQLPGEATCLPMEESEALLSGYLSADGHYVKKHGRYCASSVSRALLLGLAMLAQRARGVVASVYAGRPEREGKIQGRNVHMLQDWIFAFRNSDGYRKSGWIDGQGSWKKVRKIVDAGVGEVWDLQVAEDASFTAEGCVVHNCPLQLQVIERGLELWSNPGDTVLTPFAGIGSEGFVAIQKERKAICVELKQSYYDQCVANLRIAEAKKKELLLL